MSRISAREQALDLLIAVMKKGSYSPIALNDALSNGDLSERDSALVTTLVYGVLQRKMTLDFVLNRLYSGKRELDDWVRILLWLSIYQKMYLNRIPDHALVNEAVTIAKKRGHQGISGLVNGLLRHLLREGLPDFSAIDPEMKRLSVTSSHPEWLLQLWTEQWDQQTAARIAEADNQPPLTFIRANRTRVTPEKLIARLAEEEIYADKSTLSRDGLQVESGHPAQSRAFAEGLMTIQDQSSMLVADAVCPDETMRVLDACAGPGGKTTHLAERMGNKGQLIALDLHPHKTKLIDDTAQRLGLTNIETRPLDARKAVEAFGEASFDRLLLDVPCSGLGVIRRKPEIRWEKSPEDLEGLLRVQAQILERTAPLVRAGGWLVYSTCTLNREENDQQILAFLAGHPEFDWEPGFHERMPEKGFEHASFSRQESMLQIMPFTFESDGFFIACLKRK
ncbi:MAG: 16S rRNA (cytosine(967)-C(5))-methyltransferase RsmB [Sporolactobacillus sp.]